MQLSGGAVRFEIVKRFDEDIMEMNWKHAGCIIRKKFRIGNISKILAKD